MADAAKPLRILVSGDVQGKFEVLFKRVNSILKKNGQFDLLLCVGEFFALDCTEQWNKYKSGQLDVPISTLILGPNETKNSRFYPDMNGGELCPNVTYLGRQGLYTTSNGLTIAYLSGKEGAGEKPDVEFTADDVKNLVTPPTSDGSFVGVDILMTSPWPNGVEKFAQVAPEETPSGGSEGIAQVALALRPRYHFCALNGLFYERQPYRNHRTLVEAPRHVTRFISMANVGNAKKLKFLYAFNISPLKSMPKSELTKQPADAGECPFTKKAFKVETEDVQFFYAKQEQKGQKRPHDGSGEKGAKKKHPQPTGPCWFCLSSPEVEKHLVVSVGDECYLALAKGGLTDDHVLILPIGHHQSTVSAPDEVIAELELYKKALKKFFKTRNKTVVFFERNYRSQHLQIQCVPVPLSMAEELKEQFMDSAQSHPQSFELHEIPKLSELKQIVPAGAPYFYVELPDGEKLLHRIKKGFPLQFGREVLASQELLDLTDRIDWRNCKIPKDEETALKSKFRKAFEDFDIN